ncbi:hypothetical protein MHBO_003488 [Bonamia ostreae]|uniref:Uncharacterized protein n=1 Tax=Bonamia ostreae TaxID=126728 RepID=A0ABV2AQL0_9EUKA
MAAVPTLLATMYATLAPYPCFSKPHDYPMVSYPQTPGVLAPPVSVVQVAPYPPFLSVSIQTSIYSPLLNVQGLIKVMIKMLIVQDSCNVQEYN